MKYIQRAQTKKVVAPQEGPINAAIAQMIAANDKLGANLVVGALIRSVVMAVSMKSVRSTTARGYHSKLFTPSGKSRLWLEAKDLMAWQITQGATKERADWTLQIGVGADRVMILTGRYLTVNEELEHRDRYETLRREILRVLAVGSAETASDGSDIEADASATSLAITQGFSHHVPDEDVRFSIQSSKPCDFLIRILDQGGFTVIKRTETGRVVRVGPSLEAPGGELSSYLSLECSDGRMDGHGVLDRLGSPGKQRLDAWGIKANIEKIVRLLRANDDPEAQYSGPQSWCEE